MTIDHVLEDIEFVAIIVFHIGKYRALSINAFPTVSSSVLTVPIHEPCGEIRTTESPISNQKIAL